MFESIEKCAYKDSCVSHYTAECNDCCIRFLEMQSLLLKSGLPLSNNASMQKLIPTKSDLASYDKLKKIKDNIVEFIGEGSNLYIYSKYFGNGKTTWAIKLLMKYFDEIWAGNGFRCRGLFIHVPTFLVKLKEAISCADPTFISLRNNILKADVVVWDDIASTKLSEYDHSNLLTYIDQRILANQSNIFTGNLEEKDLASSIGNRLASRVWNNSTCIEFVGGDRRGK